MKQTIYSALGIMLLVAASGTATAQTTLTTQGIALTGCTAGTSTVSYTGQSCSPKDEKRSDVETVGNTSFVFGNYSSTVSSCGSATASSANDIFMYTGSSTTYSNQILGPAIVWRQNSTNTFISNGTTSDVDLNSPYKAQVTLTFSREVTNLKLVFQDIDKALYCNNQGSDFTDEVNFYPTNAAGLPTSIAPGDVQVGFGVMSTTGTYASTSSTCDYFSDTRDNKLQAILQGKALNGGATSNPSRAGNATIVFTKPVKKVVITYRNLYTITSSPLRLQTIALEEVSWCTVSTLPVTLTTFDAKAAGADANLTWSTANEVNSDYFAVERSFDGVAFSQVGRVSSHGNSIATNNYAYTDAGVAAKAAGTIYYRLRQVDLDGTATYSPVRTVAFEKGAAALKLYPNPATPGTDNLTLDLLTLPQGDYQASLVNVVGSTVATYTVRGGEAQPLALPSSLAPGTYIMCVQGQGVHLTQRLAQQ